MDSLSLYEKAPTPIVLPSSNETVLVRTVAPRFTQWTGDDSLRPRYNANNKAVVSLDGKALFPELAILRLLEHDGWRGVWVNSYGRRQYIVDWIGRSERIGGIVPEEHQELLWRIKGRRTFPTGCWDVFAWRGAPGADGLVCFVESKQSRKDRLQSTQATWLEAALNVGVPLAAFAIVEWDWAPQAPTGV